MDNVKFIHKGNHEFQTPKRPVIVQSSFPGTEIESNNVDGINSFRATCEPYF